MKNVINWFLSLFNKEKKITTTNNPVQTTPVVEERTLVLEDPVVVPEKPVEASVVTINRVVAKPKKPAKTLPTEIPDDTQYGGAFVHTKQRLKERYDFNLTLRIYELWIKKIKEKDVNFAINIGIRPDKDGEMWMITHGANRPMYVIFRNGVIITALPPSRDHEHLGKANAILKGRRDIFFKDGKTSSKAFPKLEKQIIGSYKKRLERTAAHLRKVEKTNILKKAAIDFSASECT